MKKDLKKFREIELNAEEFFDKLQLTVKSLKLNFMELKTIIIEKNALESKFDSVREEYWSILENKFGDIAFNKPNEEGNEIDKARNKFDTRFTTVISHIFHKEYFNSLEVFCSELRIMQEKMFNILDSVQHLLAKDIIPSKDFCENFDFLYSKRQDLSQSLNEISSFYLSNILPNDEIDIFEDIYLFESRLKSRLKRIGKACMRLRPKEIVDNSKNLQFWIEKSGVKKENSKRRNPKRKKGYVGLVMKDAINKALETNKSLSPKELSKEIFTEEALIQEGNKIDKNIAAVLSREKGKIFKSLGNGKWNINQKEL